MTMFSSDVDTPGGKDDTYDVILTPSPDRAKRTVDVTRIWGKPVVIKGLTAKKAPSYMAPALMGSGLGGGNSGVAVMASLRLPQKDRFGPGGHAFRSVALRMPMLYVGDRGGDVYVFKVDEDDRDTSKDAVTIIKKASDGNDLKVVDDVLLCTKSGRITTYSLADPADPKYLGTFGPVDRWSTNSLVIGGTTAFLLGTQSITSYDIADPAHPELIAVQRIKESPWAGCVRGNYLYAAEIDFSGAKSSLGVYDISELSDVKRVGSVKIPQGGHGVHLLSEDRVLVAMDAESRTLSGEGPHGSTVILDVHDPLHPATIAVNPDTSGRTSAVWSDGTAHYLMCPGAVMELQGTALQVVQPLYTGGSNLDGAVYHGAADAAHAAIVTDDAVIIVSIKPSKPSEGK